jgi:hypothetical protein
MMDSRDGPLFNSGQCIPQVNDQMKKMGPLTKENLTFLLKKDTSILPFEPTPKIAVQRPAKYWSREVVK